MKGRKILSRTVLLLSFISLFTDVASEMLYPIMPLYLRQIGFAVVLIGILEGMAEAIAGLSKGYFGHLSDNLGKRAPFIKIGYSMSALSKPMMGLLTAPVWIFFARAFDRTGKGLRTGARDALLSDESTPETKARVFGFHRGMDTLGAAIGPTLALVYLSFHPGEYKWLFILAFVPGVLAVCLTFILKEKQHVQKTSIPVRTPVFGFLAYWKKAPAEFRLLTAGLLAFALFNSSDAFLLLLLKEKGLSDKGLIGIYIFYNISYALFSYPLGALADKIGLKIVMVCGLVMFTLVYGSIGFAGSTLVILIIFLIYGLYAASVEGISKALITNIVHKQNTATAIGFYTGLASIATLISSTIAGIIWTVFSSRALFLFTAAGVFGVTVYFIYLFWFGKIAGKKKGSGTAAS